MSKWVNEQNVHMSKFGVKWAPEVLIYYKNTPGCTMLMVYPGVPWVNSEYYASSHGVIKIKIQTIKIYIEIMINSITIIFLIEILLHT